MNINPVEIRNKRLEKTGSTYTKARCFPMSKAYVRNLLTSEIIKPVDHIIEKKEKRYIKPTYKDLSELRIRIKEKKNKKPFGMNNTPLNNGERIDWRIDDPYLCKNFIKQ